MDVIAENLRQIFGDSVYKAIVLPHSTSEDIICCFNLQQEKRNHTRFVAKEISQDYLDSLKVDISVPDPNLGVWFVYLASKKAWQDADQKPWGALACKQRQLRTLGYNTVLLPFFLPCAKYVDGKSQSLLRRLTYETHNLSKNPL